jgi:acetyl-CoA acetyltransferase
VGHTAYGKLPGRSIASLNVEAIRNALTDAQIAKDAVDALLVKSPTSHYVPLIGQRIAEACGLQPKLGGAWEAGGASGITMIMFAALAIEAGQCEVAVVTMADNPRTGTRAAYERPWGDDAVYGLFGIASQYGLVMRRHMEEFGTTAEQFGEIAVAVRANGARNPNAQLQLPLMLDAYMESPLIIEPLRRDDICLISDGAAAVVVTSAKRARELGAPAPVPILGFGHGQTSWEVAQRPQLTSTLATESGRAAFAMAGISPGDVDVAELYDCYTIAVLMTLEDYGFCKKGEGGRFVEGGRVAADGDLPINTSGGLLSETGLPGMQHVVEGVRQLRGAANVQVPNAQTCVVSNQGGSMHTHATLVLGT